MSYHLRIATGLVAVLLLSFGTQSYAELSPTNVAGMNQTIMDMLGQIKTLQREVQQLRGAVELNAHTLNMLKTRQLETPSQTAVTTIPTPQLPVAPIVPSVGAPSPMVQKPSDSSVTINAEEQSAYDNAFSLLRSGSYDEAVKSFRDFLSAHPKGQLAANSQYWIGEAYYVTRRFKEAMPEFQSVVNNYPDSAKTGDALLKISYIQYEFNQPAEAMKSLEAVITRFPQSSAAKLAESRLAKMKR